MLVVSRSLTWGAHAKKTAVKALNSTFALKQNMSGTTPLNMKNAFFSYGFPIISYGSALWKLFKCNLKIIKSNQQKRPVQFRRRLELQINTLDLILRIISLPLFHELNVLLFFCKILSEDRLTGERTSQSQK